MVNNTFTGNIGEADWIQSNIHWCVHTYNFLTLHAADFVLW